MPALSRPKEKKTIYLNVFPFTERLRVKKNLLDDNANASGLLAHNLDQCLLGKAEGWYTSELSENSSAALHTNVDLWYREFESRFKEAPGVVLCRPEGLR